jgi:hypothetical protein
MPQVKVTHGCLVSDSKLLTIHVIFIPVYQGPKRRRTTGELAGEDTWLQTGSMRLPGQAAEVLGQCAFDTRKTQNSFGIMVCCSIPEAPEVFQSGVSLTIEEGMLQTVGLITGEAIRNVYGMARF